VEQRGPAARSVKLILEPIFEADFQPGSFGYRPQRAAHEAVDRVCRFRFQSGTGGLREIKALREMSHATFSVSIETGSKFFRFQLGLIDRLIDHTMNGCRVSSTTQTTHVA